MVLISEARDMQSRPHLGGGSRANGVRALSSGRPAYLATEAPYPDPGHRHQGRRWFPAGVGLDRPLRLTNLDKVYFPDEGLHQR